MRVAAEQASTSRAYRRVAFRKRALDLVVGTVLSLFALPVIVLLAIGVAVSLRAWPFFVQTRSGWRDGEVTVVKLRTLAPSTPRYMDKHTLNIATMQLPWLCRVLRNTHLDELPQIFSVVTGSMSLVGPRPAMSTEVEPMAADYERARRSVRPGCSGMWQLSVASTDTATSSPRFDLFYLQHASTRLDIWIIVRTVGWMLGRATPIEIVDVPQWLLGPGLMSTEELRAVAEDSDLVLAAESRLSWTTEDWAPEPRHETRTTQPRPNVTSADALLASDGRWTLETL